jgi:hypothetical protein
MTTSLHIIFKQQFHLRFIGGEIAVHTLSAALSRWQRDVLLPGMQQILDELDVADQHLRLDALQIDAGEITGGDWEQQLANKICWELRKEIISRAVWSKSTNEIKTGPGNDKNGLDKKYAGNPSGKKPVDDSVAGFKHNSYKASYPDIAAQQKHNNNNDLTIEGEGTALPGFSEASPQLPVTGAPDIMATDMHNSTGSSQLSAFTQEEKKNEDDLRDKISRFNEAEQLELVLYYLQTGALPWYAAALPGKDTLHWLNELITAGYLYSKAGIAFISAHPVALQRLLMQVTPVLLQQSFRQWNTPVFQQYFPEIDRIATSLFDVGNARVWAYAVLYDLLADPAMSAPVPLWKQWLTSENIHHSIIRNIFTRQPLFPQWNRR